MLNISVKKEELSYRVELDGEFDAKSVLKFDTAINDYELTKLKYDMEKVTFLSPSGLRKLMLIAKKQYSINRTKPRLIKPSENIKMVLLASGLLPFFQVISKPLQSKC
ncbi:MAG TPA: hypothetical protein DD381_07925 [Lentisphaeria bacterium]|nr:MAG: hypothetical protein A2X47_04490 [Lentisphaerae bacterium GWF2_38_69]HBM16249.1 hypothetical protein [Lentisphaeria bacterium]